MPLHPDQKSSAHDICLSDGRSSREWYLKFAGPVQRSAFSRDSFALDIRREGKRIGNFDEQRSWVGGRGNERISDDVTGFYDSMNAWTLADGHVTPSLKWYFSDGIRTVNTNFSDTNSINFTAMVGGLRYVSNPFTASAQTADYAQLWVRRIGTPGTFTFELCSDSAGVPNTVLKTVTKTTADFPDILSKLEHFDWTSTQALSAATVYHIKVYGAATDDLANHWEIGTHNITSTSLVSSDGSTWNGETFEVLYRICDADVARRWWFYTGTDGSFNAVDSKTSGASAAYAWNETTDVWGAYSTPGLGTVSDRPIAFGNADFFPQGASTNIRRYRSSTWEDEGTTKASHLTPGYDKTLGAVLWRSLSTNVSMAAQVTSGNMTFGTDIPIGDTSKSINNILFGDFNTLWVFKQNGAWSVASGLATYEDLGLLNTSSPNNGSALIGHDKFIYWNWLFSLQRIYAGRSEDVGTGFSKTSLPAGREGVVSGMATYVKWLIYSIDAGTTGTSSVWVWDGLAHHEIWRAWKAGVRVRDVAILNTDGQRSRLWIDCGSDLVYMNLPLNKARPLDDSGMEYVHEAELISSTLDMGTASDLPKFVKELIVTSKKLNGSGIEIFAQYQTDEDIGSSTWFNLGSVVKSPEDNLFMGLGDVNQFRYRLILRTNNSTIAPDLTGVVPNGYARVEYRWVWNMSVVAGNPGYADELDSWLSEIARFPGRVKMTSKHKWLHNYYVIVAPTTSTPDEASGTYQLSLLEA